MTQADPSGTIWNMSCVSTGVSMLLGEIRLGVLREGRMKSCHQRTLC
jgi:hypothetical protein